MLIKLLVLALVTFLGFFFSYSPENVDFSIKVTVLFGTFAAIFIFIIEPSTDDISPKSAAGIAGGIVAASVLFLLIRELTSYSPIPAEYASYINIAALVVLLYTGISIGLKKGAEADHRVGGRYSSKKNSFKTMILDTSVIIDGRIADVAEVGFINGEIIVPKFIIKELQYIADSGEPIKRVRGKRGLDVLKRMQQDISTVNIKITGHDFPKIREADLKLVELAKKIKGVIVTNDSNLNKIAGLQGVKVLNLNELSNALKPIVLPGETMSILIAKEGKEEKQGIGYLEDGTMVVVDDARNSIGKQIEVSVTSVLQTPTGRMVFSKIKGTEQDMVSEING
ncbi:MAG: TRAM domain-containing protein [Candidatus Dadabacteria bacterium]|nr:TRAM domain-containing protein [Candidatus Dadabacteria bacterium]NIT13654.1 TRAM domain-containing protein [Candidatus Dadabacteria bacterium]